jgi:GTP diphosphokinase / guanosine-3',5'-bis(diphosphate) 3'-diphosphatase
MNTIKQLLHAASFAARKHKDQRRKGSDAVPYINHPLEVANILADIGNIDDVDILSAAILHDTIEDTETTAQELAGLFGTRVSGLVVEVTDDKSLPKQVRKQLQIEHAPHLSAGAKQIKLADKISNIRDVTQNPAIGWDDDRRREYVEWGIAVVAGLRGVSSELEAYFDEIVAESSQNTWALKKEAAFSDSLK